MVDDEFDLPPPPDESSSAPKAASSNPYELRANLFRAGTTPAAAPAAKATTPAVSSAFKPTAAFGNAKPPGAPGGGGLPPGFQPLTAASSTPAPPPAIAKSPSGALAPQALPGLAGKAPAPQITAAPAPVTKPVQTLNFPAAGTISIDVSTIEVTYRDDQRWALGLQCTDLPEFREKQLIEQKQRKEREAKEQEGRDRDAKEREEKDKKARAEMKQEELRQAKLAKEQKEREEKDAAERAKQAQANSIASAIAKAKEEKRKKEEVGLGGVEELPPPPEDEDPFAARAQAFRSPAPAAAIGATPPGFKAPATTTAAAAAPGKFTPVSPAAGLPPGAPPGTLSSAASTPSALAAAAASRAAAAAALRKAAEEASPTPSASTLNTHANPYSRGVVSPYRRQIPVAVEIAQPVKNSRYVKPTAAQSHEELAREQKMQLSQQIESERKRYEDFKKSFVPRPKKEFPMGQRQALLNVIQSNNIMASADGGTGGMQVTVEELDKVLSEAGSLAAAETYLSHLQNTGKRCQGFDALVEAVAVAREELVIERQKLGKYLGVAWSEAKVSELFEGCCAAGNTMSYVRQFCPLPHKPENVTTMVTTIKTQIAQQKEKGKQDLIKYLSSNECSLFTGPVALKQSDLRRLIATGGGYAPLVLANLKCLDALGERFSAFDQLEGAMTCKKLIEFKQELLTSLFRLRNALFKSVMKVAVNLEAVNLLLADGQGALSTLEILELVASGAEEPFQTMNEVCESVRTFADARSESMVKEIDKVFSFMERNGLFSVSISATSGDVKRVVAAIFDANYGITGGDCCAVLKTFVDRKQAFTTFDELIAAIKGLQAETEAKNIQLVHQGAGGLLSWNTGK